MVTFQQTLGNSFSDVISESHSLLFDENLQYFSMVPKTHIILLGIELRPLHKCQNSKVIVIRKIMISNMLRSVKLPSH